MSSTGVDGTSELAGSSGAVREVPPAGEDSVGVDAPELGETSSGAVPEDPPASGDGEPMGEAESEEDESETCASGQILCDGACRSTQNDPLACGAYCVDCTAIFGDAAGCMAGHCEQQGDG